MDYLALLKAQAEKRLSDSQLQALRPLASKVFGLLYRNNLRRLAVAFGTDKEGSHFYAGHYQHHLHHLRRSRIRLLEIGVGGYKNPERGGNSLRMWKAYFTRGQIYGIDIYDKTYHDEKRIKTFQGSQVDEVFLRSVVAEMGGVDVVIDDGSHCNDHVIKSFQILFPLLSPDGIYAIEDLQTSYWSRFAGDTNEPETTRTSMEFLKNLVDGLNYEEFPDDAYTPSYFDKHIVAMHFYHNLAFIHKGLNNEGSNKLGKRFSSG